MWLSFVERQLSSEMERFNSLDQKAGSLITSSGALVSLIFAVAALVVSRAAFRPNIATLILAMIGLMLFVAASVVGLIATRTMEYSVPDGASLEKVRTRDNLWKRSEPSARNIVMWWDIRTLSTLRESANKKAWWITVGRSLQIAAAIALSSAATVALFSY